MGITHLFTTLKDYNVSETLDLVEVAKGYPGGMKILVDFYNWEHDTKDKFWHALNHLSQNQYLKFDGGEYSTMDMYLKSIIEALRRVNIELEFFLDGAKGSSRSAAIQKMKTWEKRHNDDQRKLAKCFSFFNGQQCAYQDIRPRDLPRPCLQECQNINTLLEAGCKVHQKVSGEADSDIAQCLRTDDSAFGVFSNDTDFCIFPGSVMLPSEWFDMDNDLGLREPVLFANVPKKLTCRIVRSSFVVQHFNLPNEAALIELATMAGNDYTLPHLMPLPEYHSTYYRQMSKVADLVRDFGRSENCPFFGPLITSLEGFKESVEHSRMFYNLSLPDNEINVENVVPKLLAKGIRELQFPSTVMAMHKGFYWHRTILEDPMYGVPTQEMLLAPLRSHIYALLLPSDEMSVEEHGRTNLKWLDLMPVSKVIEIKLPSIAKVIRSKAAEKMELFEKIITHQETRQFHEGKSIFREFGLRLGFLVHLLRYFLVQNWGQHLHISTREFYALAAWILDQHDPESYWRMNILPTSRCVTVQNRFTCLYRTVYAFLGNLLNLTQDFPQPKDIFSGAAFVALYTSLAIRDPNPAFRESHPVNVNYADLCRARTEVWRVVKEKGELISLISEGIFECRF